MSQGFFNFPGQLSLNGIALNASDGYILSGTTETSVYVNGDASLGADTVVNGDLVVNGKLTNPSGFNLTVFGDLKCLAVDFTPANTGVTQGDVIVHGDLATSSKQFITNATVIADDFSGNLQLSVDLGVLGIPNDNTAILLLTSGDDAGQQQPFTYGSPDNTWVNNVFFNETGFYDHTGNTCQVIVELGAGFVWPVNLFGTCKLTVYGDAVMERGITMRGNQDTRGTSGGSIQINGDLVTGLAQTVDVSGTKGTDSAGGNEGGGNGGTIVIHGNASAGTNVGGTVLLSNGCDVDGITHAPITGAGGSISVGGNLVGSASVNSGSSTGTKSNAPPKAGSIFIGGSYVGQNASLTANGGSATTDFGLSFQSQAGAAGSITVLGNVSSTGSITLSAKGGTVNGPNNDPGNPGNIGFGGSIEVHGHCQANIDVSGGTLTGGIAAVARYTATGSVLVHGDLEGNVTGTGFSCNSPGSTMPSNSGSGVGATVTVHGNMFGTFSLDGGALVSAGSTNARAGFGGSLTVDGNLKGHGTMNGGAITTPTAIVNAFSGAGHGGALIVNGNLFADGVFHADGSSVTGGSVNDFPGVGGQVTVNGDCFGSDFSINAGQPNAFSTSAGQSCSGFTSGGFTSGNFTIKGDLTCGNVSANASSNNSGNTSGAGGIGGVIIIDGDLTVIGGGTIQANGGATGTTSSQSGGTGGQIIIGGYVSGNGATVRTDGGNGPTSGAGGAGAGGAILLGRGGLVDLLSCADGTATLPASSGGTIIRFNGTVMCGTVTMNNRSTAKLGANTTAQGALFTASILSGKNKLYDGTATETDDISGLLATSLFRFADGVWAVLTQTNTFNGSVATTDATTTTVQTLPTKTDTTDQLRIEVAGRRTGGSSGSNGDSAAFVMYVRVKNIGGTVTVNNLTTDYTSQDQSWVATVTASGTNALVQVTGAANNNISWVSTATRQRV